VAIDAFIKYLSTAISKVLAREDPWPLIPARIQDEIRFKTRLRRQCQITRYPALKAEVNRL
jgi:hypothetical protein